MVTRKTEYFELCIIIALPLIPSHERFPRFDSRSGEGKNNSLWPSFLQIWDSYGVLCWCRSSGYDELCCPEHGFIIPYHRNVDAEMQGSYVDLSSFS